jgi:D-alanine-D-alanine ligase
MSLNNKNLNILLICGGGQSEHEISILSSAYLKNELAKTSTFNVITIEIKEGGWFSEQGELYNLDIQSRELVSSSSRIDIDYVIPCIHGYPGETGDLQSILEISAIPYLGCGPEASVNSFNKITSKLWYDAIGIPNTPYLFLTEFSNESIAQVTKALKEWGSIFIKAAKQGSSVGCYNVTKSEDIAHTLELAFSYSNQVLVEKSLRPREIELSAYEMNGVLKISKPGEVKAPSDVFYTYEEKYSENSHSTTDIVAQNLTENQLGKIDEIARKAFVQMQLKDLSRIDFFLNEDGNIYLNEINTFPGMTPISMFPKMMEANGDAFSDYLKNRVYTALKLNEPD